MNPFHLHQREIYEALVTTISHHTSLTATCRKNRSPRWWMKRMKSEAPPAHKLVMRNRCFCPHDSQIWRWSQSCGETAFSLLIQHNKIKPDHSLRRANEDPRNPTPQPVSPFPHGFNQPHNLLKQAYCAHLNIGWDNFTKRRITRHCQDYINQYL
jgi:hypothetical protein